MAFNWQTEYHRYRKYFTNLGQVYQQKKTRTYAGIIFSLLTVSFFLFFAIKPTVATITRLTRQIKDQKEVAQKMQAKINSLRQAQDEYTLIESEIFLIDQALPENPQISLLLREIEALARYTEVTLETARYGQTSLMGKEPVTPEKTKKGEKKIQATKASSFNLTLALTGNYQNLKNFLQTFSSLRRVVLVDSFIFKRADKENQPLSLSLNAQAYYLKPDQK